MIWVLAISGCVVGLAAWLHARHTARKLAEITHLYWQLKSDYGELKAKVDPPQPKSPVAQQTFVPLSSIKKS